MTNPAHRNALETAEHRPGFAAILRDSVANDDRGNDEAWLQDTVSELQKALRSYGMEASVRDFRLTPNAALVRFKGNDNISVDRIEKRRETLFTTWGLEIIAIRAGRGFIMVMVSRESRATVPTGRLWLERELPETAPRYNTSFVIGEREDTGGLLYANLAHPFGGQPVSGPHILIAGESGSGKGVLTANIMLEICATNDPSMAQIVIIDPKGGVDYAWIEKTRHLQRPIVTDQDESIDVYGEIVAEMERRYNELMGPTRSRDIDAYNKVVGENDPLPRIYVFHDEMADWMGDHEYRNKVKYQLTRLSAKGRAAGIHLVLITQRPDKHAIPGQIKANIANKIALRVANKVNSNIIIDSAGAEMLMGQGHMMAIIGGIAGGPVYAQSPFLDPWDAELLATSIGDDLPVAEAVGDADADSGEIEHPIEQGLPKAA